MAEYAQMNPGLHHIGYRFPTPVLVERVPEEVNQLVNLKFKTAVVVNRVVYVGNVEKTDLKNQTVIQGDAMYKSGVNKFDTFADFRIIEASVHDGDNIIKLEEYADRILQFKKNKMHLINISQEIEFLEDTFIHKGVSHPAAVCKTDFGIAWVNSLGCYLYDGQKVINLLEKGGRQIIKESDWDAFVVDSNGNYLNPIIGYIPKKRQLILISDIGGGLDEADLQIYLYDMVTQSWVRADNSGTTVDSSYDRSFDNNRTNFVTDWNGDLVWARSAGSFRKWDDTSHSVPSGDFIITTKDLDFGQPGQRKKVYKVIISYKSNGASNAQCTFSIDGKNNVEKAFSTAEFADTFVTAEQSDGTTDNLLNGAISSTTATAVTVDDGSTFSGGDVIKVGSEHMLITGISVNVLTVIRGFSGTTAATASDDAAVSISSWSRQDFVPNTSSDSNNIYSFKIHIGADGTVPAGFEINDISIVYRLKPVK
jgi:hypothetical protein